MTKQENKKGMIIDLNVNKRYDSMGNLICIGIYRTLTLYCEKTGRSDVISFHWNLTTVVLYTICINLQAVADLGFRTLTFDSAILTASALNCGFNAARTALAQIAEKRM